MRISKFVHSCLLVEEQNTKILIDPGDYTKEENALDISIINNLDYLLITHEHSDHMDIPTVKEIVAKFKDIKIITTPSACKILQKENISAQSQGDEKIQIEEVPHENIVIATPPPNTLFRIFGKLTHPGDSFAFTNSTEILALPIQAPWGSFAQALQKAVEVKPKVVIPIHDWHWRQKARERLYARAKEHLAQFNIKFCGVEKGLAFKD